MPAAPMRLWGLYRRLAPVAVGRGGGDAGPVDSIGAAPCLAGAALILFGPRPA
jgi:hypothetical protein